MNKTFKEDKNSNNNPLTASDLPLSLLNIPNRFQELLEKNGVKNIDGLALRIEDDPKSILAIEGIGPKTLLNLKTALESYSSDEAAEEHHPPVQSLGGQFRSVIATKEDKKEMKDNKVKKEKKAKKIKKNKKGKKAMKKDKKEKKKDKKEKKKDKKEKIVKKIKKGKKEKKKDKKEKKKDKKEKIVKKIKKNKKGKKEKKKDKKEKKGKISGKK